MGAWPHSSGGTGWKRAKPLPTKSHNKQTALASGEMKLLKNSAFVGHHDFLVFIFPHSTLKQRLKWWRCLCSKASQKAVKKTPHL